jgi:hypothetical protein
MMTSTRSQQGAIVGLDRLNSVVIVFRYELDIAERTLRTREACGGSNQ